MTAKTFFAHLLFCDWVAWWQVTGIGVDEFTTITTD